MLKLATGMLIALATFLPGCKRNAEIVEGGVYALAGSDGDYTISKVPVLDESVVHLRSYKESFKAVPTAIETHRLTVFVGHAP